MKRIIYMINRFFLKIIIYLYYGVLSIRDDIKTKKYAQVKIKNDFTGGKVMLLALYEKSSLRNDTLELIKEAKRNNVFVVAVNTLRLEEHNYPLELVDVYIERDNYGRDFGSYKAGMKYFFDKGFHDKCERLLIINDSVFFSKHGLPEFVHNLFNTDVEVLGATENSQHSHHLGSFCISVAGKIVRNVKFKNFWFNYKSSNVRPLVIKRGEFGLSKLLKSLVSSEQNFRSLFNISFMERKLSNDKALYESYYYYRREGESSWRNRSITGLIAGDEVLSSYYNKYILANKRAKSLAFASNDLSKYHAIEQEYSKLESSKVDYLEAVNFFKSYSHKEGELNAQFKQRLISLYLDEFTLGSQIHINCLALHHVGLPIIKLDLMFRCVCNMNDIIKLRDQLEESQKEEFMTLILARLCGDKFLVGLNRLAYQFGIL
ncbi:rhamnan synthesis F family protein [Pantoea sp. EABMAA-21]|uniref:rhamnan synthesis F family protein n=1 Tax=Pantoea sp. EABMAA-21 TaxID=3043302 RepID=UPI0024B5070E|nr:rhamnan synthesis F family protein [Pantoea sp. EABMAA-21]MDI9279558.1 rhamnan synthesis F family protein [Pantoea sp. EABMAA-21]